jgi:acid phosphatase type 7
MMINKYLIILKSSNQHNKRYSYIVGSSVGESAVFKLTTPPPLGTKGNYTFIMYGDMGIFEYAFPTVYHVTQLVQNGEVDLIYHAGDMGYGDDRKAPFYEVSWNLFMEQMQIAMEYVPYMTCVGNHEVRDVSIIIIMAHFIITTTLHYHQSYSSYTSV